MAAALAGSIQIRALDAAQTREVVLAECDIASCGSVTDKEQKPFLPLKLPWVNPDSYIGIYFKCTEASKSVDYDQAGTVIVLDVTYRRVGEKAEFGKVLRNADFSYGRNIAGADVTLQPTLGRWSQLGLYKVPAGIQVAVGRRSDGYAYTILYSL